MLSVFIESNKVFGWCDCPFNDEIAEYLNEHNYEITDWDCDELTPYFTGITNIDTLNELADFINNSDDDCISAFEAYLEDGNDIDTAISHVKDYDYVIWYDCDCMAEVAYKYTEETGMFYNVSETIKRYFDYVSFGRDMSYDGSFHFIGNDCVELTY